MALINQTQQEYYNNGDFGNYQFTSLKDIIDQFMVVYVGEGKAISKASRLDVAFHAQRAMQELSFDTFKSTKSIELKMSSNLKMILPQDYVNYVKLTWSDDSGIEHIIYPTSKTSNPFSAKQDANDDYVFNQAGELMSSHNLISNGDFDDDSGWTISSITGTAWVIGDYIDSGAGGTGIDHIYKNVLQGVSGGVGYIEIDAPQIIEGRRYVITYDIVIAATGSGGQLILANHTTNQSTLNSGSNDNNVDLINETVVGTHSVEWIQGSSNTGKIRLYNDANFDGVVDNIQVYQIGDSKDSTTWSNYESHKPSENNINDYQDYQNHIYWPNEGERYGLDPQHAQINGSFYIDEANGFINFSSNLSGKTVILKYISDSLGTPEEMKVHKFAEEAMYRSIAFAIISASSYGQNLVRRYKKEKFAAVRQAKLRLSNIKLEEITQIFRGKSKQIKH